MGVLQKVLIALIGLALLAVTVLTWGSIGSIATCFALGAMIAFLLLQKYLINRDNDDFQMEV